MDVIIILILGFIVLALWRYLNHEYASLKFRVRLRNLKTDLAKLVESGKIDKNDRLANYLCTSIERISDEYYCITIFSVIMKSSRLSKDKELEAVRERYRKDLKKNEESQIINRRLSYILLYYLREQHYVSVYLFIRPILFLGGGLLTYRNMVINYIQSFPIMSNNGDNKLSHKIHHV